MNRTVTILGMVACFALPAGAPRAQSSSPPAQDAEAYAATPAELRPFAAQKYYQRFFTERPHWWGPGREKPEPQDVTEVAIGLLAPLEGRDQKQGENLRDGVMLAIEEKNATGGFHGKPYVLKIHNDKALWGDSANEIVRMGYEEKVWAMIGSIDGANTHVALRVALKAEFPMVVTASTDPTMNETMIPWLLRCIPDDRQNGYRLARHVFGERGLKRVAVLRVNDKYGRMGIGEFRDAARRLGLPLPIEMRFLPGDTDFTTQLERIRDMAPDAVVLWADASEAALILQAMRARGMTVPVFGTDRLANPEFLRVAGAAAEGLTVVTQYDPTRVDAAAQAFRDHFRARFGKDADVVAAYSYDGANILLGAIERAGLNRVKILDELQAMQRYEGVAGSMVFDDTVNNVMLPYLAHVTNGAFEYRR